MNYRHAFHAGNFADVFKHAVLVGLLESFKAKSAPFCYIDTHAGRGMYDLEGAEARRTHEAADGVQRLLGVPGLPPVVRTYADCVRGLNAPDGDSIRRYPGSPLLAACVLRDGDSAILCELEPGEARALKACLRHRKTFHVHERDGYEALGALLPPAQQRGLVLIDPPFEPPQGEFERIEAALADALARWPVGRYAVWYPVKQRRDRNGFHRWLRMHNPVPWLVGEFYVHPDNSALRLNGCGLAILNPPWHFERTLEGVLDALCTHLARDGFSAKFLEHGDATATTPR